MNRLTPLLALSALALLATPAAAHLPHGEYGSFAAGASHPLFGLDHVLAMVAVGLWASLLGGRALWAVPTAFVAAMAGGFVLALGQIPLPAVEPMILASTVILGLAVAFALRLNLAVCAGLVATFGLFHGHAHGAELGGAGAVRFMLGFTLATAALHGVGIALGFAVARLGQRFGGAHDRLARGLGALTAVAGAALAIG